MNSIAANAGWGDLARLKELEQRYYRCVNGQGGGRPTAPRAPPRAVGEPFDTTLGEMKRTNNYCGTDGTYTYFCPKGRACLQKNGPGCAPAQAQPSAQELRQKAELKRQQDEAREARRKETEARADEARRRAEEKTRTTTSPQPAPSRPSTAAVQNQPTPPPVIPNLAPVQGQAAAAAASTRPATSQTTTVTLDNPLSRNNPYLRDLPMLRPGEPKDTATLPPWLEQSRLRKTGEWFVDGYTPSVIDPARQLRRVEADVPADGLMTPLRRANDFFIVRAVRAVTPTPPPAPRLDWPR